MPDEPHSDRIEEPEEPEDGRSTWLIGSLEQQVAREPFGVDQKTRSFTAIALIGTMCLATLISEVSLALRGANAAEMAGVMVPLAALATAVLRLCFGRSGDA